jgi:hypothetical protein
MTCRFRRRRCHSLVCADGFESIRFRTRASTSGGIAGPRIALRLFSSDRFTLSTRFPTAPAILVAPGSTDIVSFQPAGPVRGQCQSTTSRLHTEE